MYPVLVRFKTPGFLEGYFPEYISLYSYGFFILLGIVAAFLSVWFRRREFSLNADIVSDLFIWAFIGIFVGGKVFYYFEDLGRYLADPSQMLRGLGSGFVFYGSFIAGVPILIWRFRKLKLPIMPMLDVIAIAGALVHCFGKIGCFMSGCCHGKECSAGMGVVYTHPESSADPLNTPLYPTQLYDAVLVFCIVALMLIWYKRKTFHGQLMLFYAIIYGIGRTITEMFRGDEARGYIIEGVLTHSQFIAVIILGISAWCWQRWKKQFPVTK